MGELVAGIQPTWCGPHSAPSTWFITVAGDLDIFTGRRLVSAVDRCLKRRAGTVVLDLRRLEFLDSEGIRALLRARKHAARGGCEVCLIAPFNGLVQRIIALVSLDRIFPILDGRACLAGAATGNPPGGPASRTSGTAARELPGCP